VSAAAAVPAGAPRGELGSRLRSPVVIGVFVGVLALLVLAALLAVKLKAPPKAKALCQFGQPCPPPVGQRILRGTLWKSSLGFTVEHSRIWNVEKQAGDELVLSVSSRAGDTWALDIRGKRTTDYKGLLDDELGSLKSKFSLAKNDNPGRSLLGANVGYQQGKGGTYCGNDTTSQGGVTDIDAIVEAASKDGISIVVSFVGPDCTKTAIKGESPLNAPELQVADGVLNTIRWPSES
jgi:hypothetical protein